MSALGRQVTRREQSVLDGIEVDELIALTQALVAAAGENPPGGEGERAAVLEQECRARGLRCSTEEVEPGRPNVSAVLPGGAGPGVLLLGHSDVVPLGNGWSVDPRGGQVRDGRLHGRGAADMLGGLAAAVVAMSALHRAQVPLSGPVQLCAVVDEEETGAGIRHYVGAHVRRSYAGCIVAEPTDLQTIIAARGDASVEIEVTGRAAHSGDPSDGRNAIYGAAAVVADLESWHEELAAGDRHPLVGAPSWSVGRIHGGDATAIVPAHCRVAADRRLLPEESGEGVLESLHQRIDGLGLSERGLGVQVDLTMEMPGFETAADHPFVGVVDTALSAAGGPRMPLGGWTAACDGGFIARDLGVPVLVLGPGSVVEQAHRPDESVAVQDLLVAARAYALSAMRLLGAH